MNLAYAGITVDKENGGSKGWKLVTENHDDFGNHSLTCKDPGNDPCNWTVKPQCDLIKTSYATHSITNEIEPYVETQISNGITQGSYYLDGQVPVSWQGLDYKNYTLYIQYNSN